MKYCYNKMKSMTTLCLCLVSQIGNTFALKPEANLPNKFDFMNIEVGSKYAVENEMSDIIDEDNKVITFDDLILGNIKPINDSDNRNQKLLSPYAMEKIDGSVVKDKTNDNIENPTTYAKVTKNRLSEIIHEKPFEYDGHGVGTGKYDNQLQKISLEPIVLKPWKYTNDNEYEFEGKLGERSNKYDQKNSTSKTINEKTVNNIQDIINETDDPTEYSKSNYSTTTDPIKQLKIGIINSLEFYSDKMKANTTLFQLDNFQINLIKNPRIKVGDDVFNAKDATNAELDDSLVENILRAIQSHQINMEFSSNVENNKDGFFNNLDSTEGRGKKKKKGDGGVGLACSVALAMTLAGLLFLKMITMKAMLLSLMSLLISFSMKKGGGHSRQIEAKYQAEPSLTAPICNCKCNGGERIPLGNSGAYKFYNEHKNAYISVDPNGDEMEHLNNGEEYLPQIAFKNIYLPPGGALHANQYDRRDDGDNILKAKDI